MKTILAGVAIAALIAVPASAADMPLKAPPAPPAPAWSWAGFYFGGNVGGGWHDHSVPFYGDGGAGNDLLSRTFDGTLNFNAVPRSQSMRSSGVIGGGQIGYNWQAAPTWVLGLETDIQGSGVRGSATTIPPPGTVPGSLTSNQRLDWFGTLRGRLGVVASDDFCCLSPAAWLMARPKRIPRSRQTDWQSVRPRLLAPPHSPLRVLPANRQERLPAGLPAPAANGPSPINGGSKSNIFMSRWATKPSRWCRSRLQPATGL